MPPLKQPTSLEKMAMDVLFAYFVKFLKTCVHKKSKDDELREGVAFIKNEIRPRMPGTLAVKMYNEVLPKFVPFRNARHVRIASELLFDDEITGVKLSVILLSLEQEDLIRIRGITELEFSWKIPHSLEMLHLRDLTVFKYVKHCTDSDLATLSKHCEKLEHVDVSRSDEVTNIGLHSLASCHNLRHLSVAGCIKLSMSGLIRFLSVNKMIRKIYAWYEILAIDEGYKPGFDYCRIRNWLLDTTVYQSIESLTIANKSSDRHLHSVVAKFPNLRSIKIDGNVTGNLGILKSLSKLSRIDFYSESSATRDKFGSLLECVGPQIHELGVVYENFEEAQRGLDSIFRFCKNLEFLVFRCDHGVKGEKLVVPPFEKLRHLRCIFAVWPSYNEVSTLELGQMLMLESLRVDGFWIGVSRIRSMIVDHTTFPNLEVMELTEFRYNAQMKRCEQVVKQNNLDLKLGYLERSYNERM